MAEKRKRREIKTKGETEAKTELIKLPLTSCEDVTYRLLLMWLVITISGHLLVLADRYNRRGLKLMHFTHLAYAIKSWFV